MQVVGASVTDDAVDAVARRSTRPDVAEWAARVLRRHVRREKSLLVRLKDPAKLEAAMKADGLPGEVRKKVRDSFEAKEDVYTPGKAAVGAFLARAADTMDWIESLPDDDRRIRRINRMSWKDAEAQSVAWHASLAKARAASGDIMEGVRKLVDLDGEAFAAELTTKGALVAEGQAMGHCVGGYWARVASGGTRIVSIRDADGQPHVTIELSRAPVVKFEDGSQLLASHRPSNGADILLPAANEWVAVQVRGKGNREPVPRWMALVRQWLETARMPWVEFGSRRSHAVGGEGIPVFTVYGKHFRSAEGASDHAEPMFSEDLQKQGDFRKAYVSSGLSSIHAALEDRSRAASFLEKSVPHIIASFAASVSRGTSPAAALIRSGFDLVAASVSGTGGAERDFRQRLLETVVATDATECAAETFMLAQVPGGGGLRLVVHSLPLMPLFLLSSGNGEGMEARIADIVSPHLRSALRAIMDDPGAVHAVRAAVGGATSDDIRKAFVFCGFAAEFAAATAAVSSGVTASATEARLAVKRARRDGIYPHEMLNSAANWLADGYEERIAGLVATKMRGPGYVFSALPKPKARPMPIAHDPVMKRYRMPV